MPRAPAVTTIGKADLPSINQAIRKISQRLDFLDDNPPVSAAEVAQLRRQVSAMQSGGTSNPGTQTPTTPQEPAADPVSYGRKTIFAGETVTIPSGHILFTVGDLVIEEGGLLILEDDALLYDVAPTASTARNLFIQEAPPVAAEPILWIKPVYDGMGAIIDASLILRTP